MNIGDKVDARPLASINVFNPNGRQRVHLWRLKLAGPAPEHKLSPAEHLSQAFRLEMGLVIDAAQLNLCRNKNDFFEEHLFFRDVVVKATSRSFDLA